MRCLAVAVLAVSLLASEAGATTFTYTFTGMVTEILDPVAGGPNLIDPVNGTLIYSDGLTSSPSPIAGEVFYDSSGTVTLIVDGFLPGADLSRIIVNNDTPLLGDRFAFADQDPFSSSSIVFIDSSGTALSSTAIPTMLSLGDWSSANFQIDSAGDGNFAGTITSLTIIPEPGTAVLLSAGLVGLSAAGRRRGRTRDAAVR